MLSKKYFSQSGLQKLIDNKIEESKQLDYKDARAISRGANEIKELSKDVSAFANSEGGIIIYGINEDQHIPVSYSYIDGENYTKEWLENVIDSNISPKIQNLKIHPIRFNDCVDQTSYLVEIPSSPDSPHMANDRRYYRRYNFKSVPMEEYEIKNLYFKSVQTKLTIEDVLIKGGAASTSSGKLTRIRFSIDFLVRNIGKVLENYYKLEIRLTDKFVDHGHDMILKNSGFDRREDEYSIYLIPNESPLFQNEKATVYTVNIEITENNYRHLNELMLHLKLYYSSGVEAKDIQLSKMLKYSGQILTPKLFLNYQG